MAETLNGIVAANQPVKPEPTSIPTPAPRRGDDLIAAAKAAADLTPEQKRHVRLFAASKEIIQQRLQEDPAYGEAVLPQMEKLTGEKLADFLIDEADKIKIDYLKRTDPKFTSEDAAASGFFNDMMAGQGMRVLRGVGKAADYLSEVTNGAISRKDPEIPLEELLDRKREEFRLLQKAFPKSDIAGRIAAFVVPGSPIKAIFNTGAKGASFATGALLDRIAKNPSLLKTALQSATALGGGSAAVGGVQGTFGADDDVLSLDRGAGEAAKHGLVGFIAGGAIPPVAALAEKGINKAAPYVAKAIQGGQNAVASFVEKSTGTPASALRAYNANPAAVKAASGAQAKLGRDLDEYISQASISKLPEVRQAEALLPELPNVDATKMVSYLRSIKSPTPGEAPSVAKLEEWAKWTEDRIAAAGATPNSVPAPVMREVIEKMQEFARNEYGRESNTLLGGIKQAARLGRADLLKTAVAEGGENGILYRDLMAKAQEKRGILSFVRKQLGTHPEVIERRSEAFIDRLFGPNKDIVLKRMEALDRKFETNFVEQARNALQAKQLGPNGVPQWMTKHQTGAALLGTGTGFSLGGAPGAIGGLAVSSPKVGAHVLGMSDKVSGVAKAMFSDPAALAQVTKMGRVPFEVRHLAQEIQTALVKDGPLSASSVLRIAADTPYFVGLVNAFDYVKGRGARTAGQKALEQANQLAGPQQPAEPTY